jgi:hypothetical protein
VHLKVNNPRNGTYIYYILKEKPHRPLDERSLTPEEQQKQEDDRKQQEWNEHRILPLSFNALEFIFTR